MELMKEINNLDNYYKNLIGTKNYRINIDYHNNTILIIFRDSNWLIKKYKNGYKLYFVEDKIYYHDHFETLEDIKEYINKIEERY